MPINRPQKSERGEEDFGHRCVSHSDLGRLEEVLKDHVDEAIERELLALTKSSFVDGEPMRHKITHEQFEQARKDRKQLLMGGAATVIAAVIGLAIAFIGRGGS